jgi:hypothetical protein
VEESPDRTTRTLFKKKKLKKLKKTTDPYLPPPLLHRWVMLSTVMILAYGIGIFMLMYTPVIRHIARRDIETRRLSVNSGDEKITNHPPPPEIVK